MSRLSTSRVRRAVRALRAPAGSLLIGLLLAVLAGEWLARALDVPPRPLAPLDLPTFQVSRNPVRRFEYRPNLGADDPAVSKWYAGLCTNSAGFRDVERAVPKPAGVRRVAVLGDSVAAGYGVAETPELFVPQLERRLRAGLGELEVLNLAVAGYHTLQEVETLRELGLACEPELVLVVVCVNDTRTGGHDRFQTQLVRQGDELRARRSVLGRILGVSRLALVLHHRLSELLPEGPDPYRRDFLGDRSPVEVGFELLAELRGQHGFAALAVTFPAFDAPFESYRHGALHEEIRAAAERAGIPLIDLTEAFAARPEGLRELSFDGLHLTPLGHRVAAELLEPIVRHALEPTERMVELR